MYQINQFNPFNQLTNPRRLLTLLMLAAGLVCALVFHAAPPAHAQESPITITTNEAQATFPYRIDFSLEAASSAAPITEVHLLYGESRSDLLTIVEADIEPGKQVDVDHMLDTQVYYMPPGVEITYRWIVRDAEGNELESSPHTLRYHDDRFDWQERSDRNVTVYWYEGDGAFGDQLIDTATRALDNLQHEINATVEESVTIYVYANQADMRSAMRVNSVEWVGGSAWPSLGIIIGLFAPGDDQAEMGRLIPHELSHHVLHQATDNPYGGVPRWFDEGLAMYNQDSIMYSMGITLESAARQGKLIPLEALASSFPTDPQQALLSYAQSHSIVSYIIETYGTEATRNLTLAFEEATPLEEALQETIGLSVDELDAAWRATMPTPLEQTNPEPSSPQRAPRDRFSAVSPSPPQNAPPQVNNPAPMPRVVPPTAPAPVQTPGFVFPLWLELGLALGFCVVAITFIGVVLLVALRFVGVDKQV
jgi:hypothetical protein